MKLKEALKKGHKVCVALKDDKREVGCYIVFAEENELTELLNTIVGDVEIANHKDFEYIKTLYVSEKPLEELLFEGMPSSMKGVA